MVLTFGQSEDDTSDEEKQKEIDKRKDEEAKNKAKAESKFPSGASSKGTNTPSGRPKHTDPLKKGKNLKRPGSPGLSASEASGNESSRKKHKKKHTSQPGTNTPIPGSRPMSPAPASQPALDTSQRRSSILKFNVPPSKLSEIQSAPPNPSPISGGPTSDGEVTEMSDGGTKKKIKLRLNQSSTTASRAGSPALGGGPLGNGGGNTGSRAGSPVAPGTSMPSTLLSSLSSISTSESKGGVSPKQAPLLKPRNGKVSSQVRMQAATLSDCC
jgi:transcription initiation factor TFIIF subunit alpha